MTQILLTLKTDSLEGLIGADGYLLVKPTHIRFEGSNVVVPDTVQGVITNGDFDKPFIIPSSEVDKWLWEFTLVSRTTNEQWDWVFTVPDIAEIELAELVENYNVDPTTVPEDAVAWVQATMTPLINNHINDATPHPIYDDAPSFKLIFENGLI